MAKSPSSGLWRKLFNYKRLALNERAILIARFAIVTFNYWFIFHRPDANRVVSQFTLPALLFILIYGLTIWYGPKFLKYHIINIILSFPEILLVSFGFYHFSGELVLGGFLIYLVGIISNILYGGYLSSILLALLVNLCYTFTVFHRLKPEQYHYFYLLIINFNLVALLVGIVGWKIKKIHESIQFEKEESKKQLFRLQALSRITKEITSELELNKLLNLIVKKTSELMKSKAGGIITLDNNNNSYRIKAIKGIPKNCLGKEVRLDAGLLGQALNERNVAIIKVNAQILDTASNLDEQYNFLIASPILSKGDLLGLIFLLSDCQSSPLGKDDKLILETMSEFAAIGIVNANLFKTTVSLCTNDYLTGVGNLRYFYQQLEHCIAVAERYQQPCSLLMVDSDCFREIKHTYGNAQAFAHIKYLADLLKKCIRNSDLIARYDRDTFMLILPQTTLEEAIILGERIKYQVINNPNLIDGQSIITTVSIGIASYPTQAKNVKNLVNAVESALQRASELGNNKLIVASRLNNITT